MKTSAVSSRSSRWRAALVLPQVEDDAALAPVVEGEGRVGHVALDAQGPEHLAHRIAGGRLDLDRRRRPSRPAGRRPTGRPPTRPISTTRRPAKAVRPSRCAGSGLTPVASARWSAASWRKVVLHDLAGGVDRELVDDRHHPGSLVVGHLAPAPLDDVRR